MMRDAEEHAKEDAAKREMVTLRNSADQVVYQTERALKDAGDKVPTDVRGQIEGALADLKSAMEKDDKDAIKAAMENLQTLSQKIGEAMYAGAQQPGGGPEAGGAANGPGGGSPEDPEIVDAEIVDEKDEK